jgi:hypothetical protein
LVGDALQLNLDVTLEKTGLDKEPSHLGKRLGDLLVTISLKLGTLQQYNKDIHGSRTLQ